MMKKLQLIILMLIAFPALLSAQSGDNCTGAYQNDQPHGAWLCTFANDSTQIQVEVSYNEGVVNGLKKEYYSGGQLKQSSNYLNGNLDGETKAYYTDGTLKYEGSFINGKPDGIHKEYNSAGALSSEETYN